MFTGLSWNLIASSRAVFSLNPAFSLMAIVLGVLASAAFLAGAAALVLGALLATLATLA